MYFCRKLDLQNSPLHFILEKFIPSKTWLFLTLTLIPLFIFNTSIRLNFNIVVDTLCSEKSLRRHFRTSLYLIITHPLHTSPVFIKFCTLYDLVQMYEYLYWLIFTFFFSIFLLCFHFTSFFYPKSFLFW